MINVTVKLFGVVSDIVGQGTLEYGLAKPATVGALMDLLYLKYPRLTKEASFMRIAVNDKLTEMTTQLCEGDEVKIMCQM